MLNLALEYYIYSIALRYGIELTETAMNKELLWAIRTIERYSCYGNVSQDDNLDSVARTLSTVIRYQQEQIAKLQDTVDQLVAINNDATLNNT